MGDSGTKSSIRLNIAVPVPDLYDNCCCVSWAMQLLTMKKPPKTTCSVNHLRLTSVSRNALVYNFLKGADDYMLFIDTDVIPPPDGITRLLKCCDRYDVASGLYFERQHAQGPVAYTDVSIAEDGYPVWARLQKWDGSTIPVEAVGMGFCMISRKVLETINEPYFIYMFDKKGGWLMGEDMYFCKKVRDAGFTIGLDTGCRCLHIKPGVPVVEPGDTTQ